MSFSKKRLDIVRVVDVEKRKYPSKHYVYVIEVQWNDGSLCRIGRRFSAFFDMHMSLLEKFPLEGGKKDPSKRTIPYLPGKTLFHRNHTKEMTMKRLVSITEYCEALTNLPDKISQCDIIIKFFEGDMDDKKNRKSSDSESQGIGRITGPVELESYRAIAEYKADDKTQISLNAGEIVEVVEKNENGWWLVCNAYGSNGWVPGAYLENEEGEKEDILIEKSERGEGTWYEAITTYQATSEDEISFPVGGALEVTQKTLDGWWLASFNGQEGWVPGSYLKQMKHPYKIPQQSDTVTQQLDNVTQQSEVDNKNEENFQDLRNLYLTRKLPPKRSTIRRQVAPVSKVKQADKIVEEAVIHTYVTICAFEAAVEGGISFEEGKPAQVIEQADNGWWYVSIGGKEGWVPADYLKINSRQNATQTPPKSVTPPVTRKLNNISHNSNTSDVNPTTTARQGERSSLQERPSLPARPQFPGGGQSPSKKPLNLSMPQRQFVSNNNSRLSDISPEGLSNFRDFQNFEKKPNTKLPDFEEFGARQRFRPKSGGDQPMFPVLKPGVTKEDLPAIEDEEWFKDVPRVRAEEALMRESKEGNFLVRRSKAGGPDVPFSITLLHQGRLFNFHIRKRRDGRFATGVYSEGEKSFESVREMIEFYRNNTLVVGDYRNLVKLTGSPQI